MDRATLIGVLLGGSALVGGHFMEGGTAAMIFQITALVIVFGGTIGAVCVSFPRRQLKEALKGLPHVLREPADDRLEQVRRLVDLSYRARRHGLLSLDRELKGLPDSFWRRSLGLVIDGFPADQVREVMEAELARQEENDAGPAQVFEAAGGYAPTIGILGAVLGIIQVMQHLTDPAKLGSGVAVAFVATIYGVASANLIFLPIAHKLRVRQKQDLLKKEMILEGILALAQGEHPRLMVERLQGFLKDAGDAKTSLLVLPKVRVLTPRRQSKSSFRA